METTSRAGFGKTAVVATVAALAGALTLGLVGAIAAIVVIASGMNAATSSPAQKDWFPIMAVFWGIVGGMGGAVCGALLGGVAGIVINRVVRQRNPS
jgi:hypothetical protein